jgi:D-alanyl-lipoteichoic acid acyltransferase DltB (MBOAT superfamily)
MLFHSPSFLFVFLPITLASVVLADRYVGRRAGLVFLLAASLVFYASWTLAFLAVLLGSAVVNFGIARLIERYRNTPRATTLTVLGVAANIAFLGYFKYVDFFIENINLAFAASGTPAWPLMHIALPLGVSFFTFQQIAYLADTSNERHQRHSFVEYLLFVSFFGSVTSGPITTLREILPQLRNDGIFKPTLNRVLSCAALFSFGLFKKIVVAEAFAPTANAMFGAVAHGQTITMFDAWGGTVAYFLQLYFDFSGYCDMALAIAALVGIKLPINFNSPLKATSILEYWKRWHITLTRFITMYLYMPMAVRLARYHHRRKSGPVVRFVAAVAFPSVVAFALAGLWHGAGWNYIVFGLLWGVALTVNYAWREARMPEVPAAAGWLLTMLVALVSMVLFRSETLHEAGAILAVMFGGSSAATSLLNWTVLLPLESAVVLFLVTAPNTAEILRDYPVTTDEIAQRTRHWLARLTWRPSVAGTAWTAMLITFALLSSDNVSGFLYYKF